MLRPLVREWCPQAFVISFKVGGELLLLKYICQLIFNMVCTINKYEKYFILGVSVYRNGSLCIAPSSSMLELPAGFILQASIILFIDFLQAQSES